MTKDRIARARLIDELRGVKRAMELVEFHAREPDLDLTPETCRAIIKDALAALASLPDDPWQPIETAPKDGTMVLLWCQPTSDDAYAIQGWFESGVFDRRWYDAYSGEVTPTHWQPLPGPPAAAIRKEGV